MKKIILAVGFMLAGQLGNANAMPVTLDFDTLPISPSTLPISFGSTIDEDGFRLTTTNGFMTFSSYNNPASSFYTGSTSVFANTNGGITTLTQINGDPFSITNIALAFRTVAEGQTGSVTFTGQKSGGSVMQTLSYVQGPTIGLQTLTFDAAFTDLLSLTWVQGSEGHQFDNLVVDGSPAAVPEPGTLALFGLGLLGLGYARRKKAGQA